MARNRQHNARLAAIAFAVGFLPAASALAQQSAAQEESGGLQARIGLHFDRDDNLYDSSEQELESWIARISPELLLSTTPGKRQFSIQYIGDYGKYFEESDDDYQDHSLTARGLFQAGARGELGLTAKLELGHEGRGSGLTRGLLPDSAAFPTEPDEFERGSWTAEYTHGARATRGQLNFGIGGSNLQHSNNRDRTRFFDRSESIAFGGVSIRIGDRTAFVLQARYVDTDYDVDRPGEPSLSGDDWQALVGFTWEATSKTEGSIRVGAKRREFDDAAREADTTASWDVAVRWSPRTYSHFDFGTSRENEATIGEGNFIDRSRYGVGWTHEWGGRLETELRWERQDDDFSGTIRKEEQSDYYFGFRIPQGNRVVWEAGVTRESRNSTIADLEYEGMLYTIGVIIQLTR